MPEFALSKIQYGLEATDALGTAVAADTILPGFAHPPIQPDRMPRFPEESLGVRSASARNWIGQYLVQDTLVAEDATYQILPVIFSIGLKGNISPSNDSGAYTWDFGPSYTATNDLNTITLEMGDDQQAYECSYVMAERIAVRGTVEQGAEASPVAVEVDYFARQWSTTTFSSLGIDSDLPGAGALQAINAKTAQFWVDSTWAAVGTTERKHLRSFEIEVLTGVHPKFYATSDNYFTEHGEGMIGVMANFTFEGDSDAVDYFTAYQSGDLQVARLKLSGGDISGAAHSLTIDISGAWESVIPLSEQDRGNNVWSATLHGYYDATGAKSLDVEVITDVAAI